MSNSDMQIENEKLTKALHDLRTAVAYNAPPVEFNGVLCYEARVPVEFVTFADEALGRGE